MFLFLTRLLVSLGLAFLLVVALFLTMASMISRGDSVMVEEDDLAGVEFVRLRREPELQVKEREIPKKPPPPKEPPPPPKLQMESADKPQQDLPDLQIPNLNLPSIGGGSGPNLSGYNVGSLDAKGNRGLIPKIIVPANYPQKALMDGLEGYVRFRILVGEDGTVLNAEVVEFSDRIFVNSAQRVIYRWKFEPRIQEGVAVQQEDVYQMDFVMEK